MKYLKLYESFEEEHYVQIGFQEFNLEQSYNDNPWRVIGKLREILPSDVEYTSIDTLNNSISFTSKVGNFTIKFGDDEWFKVRHTHKRPSSLYYKCDQLDGLVKLLKDLRLI
jgi:hypothetical protein